MAEYFGPKVQLDLVRGVPIQKIRDWIEKQKEQKPAEWSEEDERKRNGLIKGLEDRMGFGWASDPFSREEYITWLKSLRPQPHWKPSEEQMKALGASIVFHKDDPFVERLRELYNQLQKL